MRESLSPVNGSVSAAQLDGAAYRTLFEAMPDAVLIVADDGTYVDVNESLCRLLKAPREQLVGAHFSAFIPPDRLEEARAAFGTLRSVGGLRMEFPLRAMDGTVVELEWCSRADFLPGLHFCVAREIGARKRAEEALRESEERYRDLFENANDIIYTLDLEGRLTSVNRRAEQAFGYSLAECLGRSVADLIPAEQHARMYEALRRKLAGEESPTVYELEVVNKDGRRVAVEVSSRLIMQGGRPVGIQGIARDVTERRRLEQELRQRAEQLAEADRRKDEFLAVLGHELRNPLAPLRNGLELLRLQGPPGPAAGELLEMMERQVKTLARLTDELLDTSRISRGKVELRKEAVDLGTVIGRAVETSRPLIERRGHQLTVVLPPERLRLQADPVRLEQVLANLLNNATKYTEPGGRIWLEAVREGVHALVRVRDTGIGIRPEALPHLFEPFHQADRLPGRVQEGLGIGLALVRGLVELHGGAVAARSDGPGRGSEFLVWLPLPEPPDLLGLDSHAAAPRVPQPAGPSCRVLVVDDNADAAESLALLLRRQGHEVRSASDGPAALQAADELRPDVVFLDLGMPGMDGYEVAQRLRAGQAARGALLVAMTGYGQDEHCRRSREAGFDHHLTKPADLGTLQAVIAAASRHGRDRPACD